MPPRDGASAVAIEVRFPLGTYHAQSTTGFGEPEWPPHPVRLIAALVAAAASLPDAEAGAARGAIEVLSACDEPPIIVAPRLAATPADADGRATVAGFRGASRWAPRNHELSELRKGVHPRDVGRGRAEVHKGGVAIGEQGVVFLWLASLDDGAHAALARAAEEITFLGTSRSPVLLEVRRTTAAYAPELAWTHAAASPGRQTVEVRVPTADLPTVADRWHAARSAPLRRDGAPSRAGLVPPVSLGRAIPYVHGADRRRDEAHDPVWWGDMLVVAVDRESEVRPKGPAAYAFARAVRSALLACFEDEGSAGEAPSALRARGSEPHAAFVPLPFVGHPRSDGRLLGLAIVLPHAGRLPDVPFQRRAIEARLRMLVVGDERPTIGVPGIGDVLLGPVAGGAVSRATLATGRWRQTATSWSTVTPVVHSRYRRSNRADSLLDQVSADCRDVGLPAPVEVRVHRTSRFPGAPARVARQALPASWAGLLKGPIDHLELTFDVPVVGPLLLGRARHFGLGLCLPTHAGSSS